VQGAELRLRYGLSGGSPSGKYAALSVLTPGGLGAFDRVSFTVRGERPLRVSVQLRAAIPGRADERWQRSVYVDTSSREHTLFFDDFTLVGETSSRLAPPESVHSIVFVLDATNTKPGSSGRLWISAPSTSGP
jgi:hypothetical protein